MTHFYKEMIDAIPMGAILLDAQDRLLLANRRMTIKLATAGMAADQLVGRTLGELNLREKHENDLRQSQPLTPPQEQPKHMTLEYDGYIKEFEITASPIKASKNKREGTLVLFNDITRRNQLESEMFKVRMQAEKLSSLGLLVSGIAHEINNPLTSIIGCSEYLSESKSLPPDLREAANIILFEAQRSEAIVRNLLTFAHQSREDKAPTDVNDIVHTLAKIHTSRLKKHGINIEVDLQNGSQTAVVNITNIQQILINLLSNSEDAILTSGVGSRIIIRTRQHGAHLALEVDDNGPGISPEILPQIFDPFFTTKEVGAGTGLGLSICHGLIREHGGSIEASQIQPRGTRFKVLLPLLQTDSPPEENTATWMPRRVLAMVCHSNACLSITTLCKSLACQVDMALDGAEVMAMIRETDYDALLLDLNGSQEDGHDLYQHLEMVRPDLVSRVILLGAAAKPGIEEKQQKAPLPLLFENFGLKDLLAAFKRLSENLAAPSTPGRSTA